MSLGARLRVTLALLVTVLAARAARAEEEPATTPATDHERVVGTVAVAFHGARFVPVALPQAADAIVIDAQGNAELSIVEGDVTVPIFGGRYWFSRRVGIDVGLGFNVHSGSVAKEIPNADAALDRTANADAPTQLALAAKVGVPISVHAGAHYNLMVIPDAGIGYTSTTIEAFNKGTSGEDLDLVLDGLVLAAGARLGAELEFGFVGVPELSVQTAWGLAFESRRRRGRIGDASATLFEKAIGTSWRDDPWDVFTGTFSVFYAF